MIRPYAYPAKYNAVDMFRGAPAANEHGPANADQVGFVAPARIWAKMDDIERSAASLNRDIDTNVREPGYIAGWKTWYANWRRNFYDKYQSNLARLGALTGSDELNAAVERERETLRGWYESYTRQRLPDGSPVPFPSGLPPSQIGTDPDTNAGWSLPWWFWLATGAAALFIGYRFYVRFQQVREQTRLAEDKLLPAVFERYGIPGKEAAEVVRAGHTRPGSSRGERDFLSPLNLAYYARDMRGGPSPLSGDFADPWSMGSYDGRDGRDPAPSFERPSRSSGGHRERITLGRDRDPGEFDMVDYGHEDRHASPNFTYDRSRDPLSNRYR